MSMQIEMHDLIETKEKDIASYIVSDLIWKNTRCEKKTCIRVGYAYFVIEKHRTAWFQLVFVHEGEYADVVFTADGRGDDCVIIVYDFLQCADWHWRSTQLINLRPLLL